MKTVAEGVNEIVDEDGRTVVFETELSKNFRRFSLLICADGGAKPSDYAKWLRIYADMLEKHKTAEVVHTDKEDN